MTRKEIRVEHSGVHNEASIVFEGIEEPSDVETLEERDLGGEEEDYEGGIYNIVSDPNFRVTGGGGGEGYTEFTFEGKITVQELQEIQKRFERYDPRKSDPRKSHARVLGEGEQ